MRSDLRLANAWSRGVLPVGVRGVLVRAGCACAGYGPVCDDAVDFEEGGHESEGGGWNQHYCGSEGGSGVPKRWTGMLAVGVLAFEYSICVFFEAQNVDNDVRRRTVAACSGEAAFRKAELFCFFCSNEPPCIIEVRRQILLSLFKSQTSCGACDVRHFTECTSKTESQIMFEYRLAENFRH